MVAVDHHGLPSSLLGLSDAVLLAIFERCSATGSIASLAACSKRLNLLARVCARRLHMHGGHAMKVYKAAVGHAAQQMPHLTSVDCQLARPPKRTQLSDPAVADFIVCLKDLPSLRQLSITSSASYTAISVLALGELRGLTALSLAVAGPQAAAATAATAVGSSIPTLAAASLHPLSRLTNLQRLHIERWQPFGLQQQQQPANIGPPGAALVQPAAPGSSCCLPVGSLSSLQINGVPVRSVHGWLPPLLACSGLQQLELVQLDAVFGDDCSILRAALDAVVYHNTQLTSLQVSVDDKGAVCMWSPPAHTSRLQELQQLHYNSSSGSSAVLWVDDSSSGLLNCTALRELGDVSSAPLAGVNDVIMPHLTRLKLVLDDGDEVPWPESVCPGLMSLGMVVFDDIISAQLTGIPCVQQLTELQLDFDDGSPWDPEADMNVNALRDLAQRAPNLRALHLVILDWFDDSEEEDTAAGPCLQAIGSFTQLHKLHLAFRHPEGSGPGMVHAHDVLRALGKLKQLQQLVLEGGAVYVTPCCVVGLEAQLPRLSVLRCVGCSGMDVGLGRISRGLREGLQLMWE